MSVGALLVLALFIGFVLCTALLLLGLPPLLTFLIAWPTMIVLVFVFGYIRAAQLERAERLRLALERVDEFPPQGHIRVGQQVEPYRKRDRSSG